MTLSTKNIGSNRKEKTAEMVDHHRNKVENLGDKSAPFYPKFPYIPKGGTEYVVSFYESELKGGTNVYVEFTDDNFDIADPERRLWMWPYNKEFRTEYATTEPHPITGHVRYMIPIEELILIEESKAPEEGVDQNFLDKLEEIPNPDCDLPMSQMTMRDYTAIHLKKPVSHKKWLNEIIIANT